MREIKASHTVTDKARRSERVVFLSLFGLWMQPMHRENMSKEKTDSPSMRCSVMYNGLSWPKGRRCQLSGQGRQDAESWSAHRGWNQSRGWWQGPRGWWRAPGKQVLPWLWREQGAAPQGQWRCSVLRTTSVEPQQMQATSKGQEIHTNKRGAFRGHPWKGLP